MTITLPPDQRQWIEAQVAAGVFPSVEEAIQAAVASLMFADDDFEWARPYIEAADASLARGEGIPGTEFFARLDRKLDTLR